MNYLKALQLVVAVIGVITGIKNIHDIFKEL